MSSSNVWFRVVLPYAVFAIEIKRGVVVRAAPVGRWMIGKSRRYIEAWVKRKGGTLAELTGA